LARNDVNYGVKLCPVLIGGCGSQQCWVLFCGSARFVCQETE